MERIFYANALKSGNSVHLNVSTTAIRDLEITPGDQLKVTLEKTGIKGRTRPDAKFPQMNNKPKERPVSVQVPSTKRPQPTPVPTKRDVIDPEIKAQILGRLKKDPASLVISQVIGETDYSEADLRNDKDIAKAIDRQK